MNKNIKKNDEIDTSKLPNEEKTKLYDEIEQKVIELKNIKKETDKHKKDAIKQLIYANKRVPNIWRNKKNYTNLVLELFSEDNNFLKYLGSGENNNTSSSIKNSNQNNSKIEESSKKRSLTYTNLKYKKTKDINNKKILRINTLESLKNVSKSNTTNLYSNSSNYKLKKMLTAEEEMINIFNNLKEQFPIRKKCEELYPDYNFDEIKINKKSNTNNNNNSTDNKKDNIYSILNKIEQNRLKRIRAFEKNIYNNFLTENNQKDNNHNRLLFKNKKYKISSKTLKDIDVKLKIKNENENKKEIIKKEINDSKVYKSLNRINFYGPYFSYCPYCYKNNIKFYKNLEKNQCLNILDFIKMERSKKSEIEQNKFREKLKMKTTFFK